MTPIIELLQRNYFKDHLSSATLRNLEARFARLLLCGILSESAKAPFDLRSSPQGSPWAFQKHPSNVPVTKTSEGELRIPCAPLILPSTVTLQGCPARQLFKDNLSKENEFFISDLFNTIQNAIPSIDLESWDNVLIPNYFFEYIYHIGCLINPHSITNSRLIAGGQNPSRERQTVFCTTVNPMKKYHRDPQDLGLTKPRLASCKQKWERHQDTNLHKGKDWNSVKQDVSQSSSTIHSQQDVFDNSYDKIWRHHIPKGTCDTSNFFEKFLQR